ncbi:MAG: hypothetical protein KDM81_15950 [Verrucomicrobiae bacterium]|nr:hypothetical protein [Verrucomicrobiae bacterium]
MTACEDCPFQDRPVTAATRQWGRVTRALSLALVACASSVLAWQASAEPPDPAPLEQQPKIIRNLFSSSATRYEAIRLLGEEDTDSARALLLQVALAQYGRVGQSYGSSIYLRAIKDQREAAKLLVSDNRGVINRALKALHGCGLNEDLWKQVEPCLHHASWGPRYDAAYLLRTDTSDEL